MSSSLDTLHDKQWDDWRKKRQLSQMELIYLSQAFPLEQMLIIPCKSWAAKKPQFRCLPHWQAERFGMLKTPYPARPDAFPHDEAAEMLVRMHFDNDRMVAWKVFHHEHPEGLCKHCVRWLPQHKLGASVIRQLIHE